MISEPTLRIPVICPVCATELLAEFPIAELAEALIEEQPVHLRSPCHNRVWNADDSERQQIREYLASVAMQKR